MFATGDDFGHVKLFRYPCPVDSANYIKYSGHSEHLTKVRFHHQVNYLISTGGADKAIFQWKYTSDDIEDEPQPQDDDDDDEPVDDDGGFAFEMEEVDEGDQALAVKAWEGEVIPPTGFKEARDAGDAPDQNLSLQYAHGYRSFDTRNNLKYTSDPTKLVYTTAALGVVLDKEDNTQEFFMGQDDDVVCLDIHPDKEIIATGQMARAERGKPKKPKEIDLHVWSSKTFQSLANLSGFHR